MKRLFKLILLLAVLLGVWLLYPDSETPPPPLTPLTKQIDHILIEKSARRMTVFRGGQPVRGYDIALGFAPEGDKEQEGDGKTPEGEFVINRRNPNSSYHLSLGINYPLPEDNARAQAAGVSPGGDIFLHGQPTTLPNAITLPGDWTAGCIAVANLEIEELWRITPNGTSVEIRP